MSSLLHPKTRWSAKYPSSSRFVYSDTKITYNTSLTRPNILEKSKCYGTFGNTIPSWKYKRTQRVLFQNIETWTAHMFLTGSENSNSYRKKTERNTHWWSQTQKDTKIEDGNIEKNPGEATHGSGFGNPISLATEKGTLQKTASSLHNKKHQHNKQKPKTQNNKSPTKQ